MAGDFSAEGSKSSSKQGIKSSFYWQSLRIARRHQDF